MKITKIDLAELSKMIKEELLRELSSEDICEFVIPEWALPALINGDFSGLSDEDEQKLNAFIDDTVQHYGNAHFHLPGSGTEDDEYDLGFRHSNDIDNLGSNCFKLVLFDSKNPSSNLNESFIGGVHYDDTLSSELQNIVGDLSKITPYVLEIGDRVESDSSGAIHVYQNGKKVKMFRDLDYFLKGIGYAQESMNEDENSSEQLKTFKQLVEDNNIIASGPNGKYMMADFDEFVKSGNGDDLYDYAMLLANTYLKKTIGMTWDDLPDINSLHHALGRFDSAKELFDEVKEYCDERIENYLDDVTGETVS